METKMLMLTDLNCPVCAAKLERAVRQLHGMNAARVEFGSGTLHVEYEPSALSLDAIRELVKKSGLGVAAVVAGRPVRL